ncbi:phospho-N-acetylmuramoyl-pentapeptide-transferase [Lapidilactobacillus bayanensis]|uniref:phospho-N-acetylmuramoyl-pentapeptide- transferase n=1 Tax=Lapidilactobacillus bayanensis TaxID=2485998 RepID=UPI000F7A37FF|nr:phospho-N-acetylmuramoyl-pentapeptide-transferase [Lapidilactobacillus bayanensis]
MIYPLIALLATFVLTAIAMPYFIKYLRRHDEGQQIRDEGPKWHEKKSGTPTMGGLIFLIAILIVSLIVGLLMKQVNTTLWLFTLVIFLYGAIGFADDSVKLAMKRNLGLTARQKFSAQVITAVIFLIIYFHDQMPTTLSLPFFGTSHSAVLFAIFVAFWIVGFSNAVNLTDGLDGLVGGLGIFSYGTYAIIAARQNNKVVLMICLAVVGGLLAFLIFNHLPAKIFMGDTGSLALGGGLAAISIILERPWSLLLIGIVYVIETASVILQVFSFKTFHKRIFKMSPIHHHFEIIWGKGSEEKVVLAFWSVGLIGSIVYLLLFL